MNFKTTTAAFVLFTLFFLVGWKVTIITSGNESLRSHEIKPPKNYISENQYKIDILHYDLKINLYPEIELLRGEAAITGLFLNKEIKNIDLNFYDNMKINSVLLNGVSTDYINSGTRLSILNKSKTDTFVIKISYEGKPKRAGLSAFVFGEINSESVVYNLNEPIFASTWFPCNDIPDDKALLDIKITNDLSKTSVSNGVLVNVDSSDNRKTYHWKTYYPISTYLICLYSAEYDEFSEVYISQDNQDTMDIKYYAFPDHLEEAKKDFKGHTEMIDFFAKTFGEYPFIKEKYGVAEFLWQLGAMEHQTISGIGSNFVNGRRFFEDVYVHELAHHWWGNAVGPATWKDIWLNEGFSTYSEALYYEYKSGKSALRSTMLSKFQVDLKGKLYDPGINMFNQTVYDKGAWVLHMLRWELGDSVFFKVLRDYFETFKYKNASTKDFQTICEKVSNKDLTQFFNQWVLEGTGQAEFEYSWRVEKENDKYLVEIEINQTQSEYEVYHLPLEISLIFDEINKRSEIVDIDSRKKKVKILSEKIPEDIVLDPDNWLLATIRNIKINE